MTQRKKSQPEAKNDITIAKIGLVSALLVAIIGGVVTIFNSYLASQAVLAPIIIPIQATQTAEAKSTLTISPAATQTLAPKATEIVFFTPLLPKHLNVVADKPWQNSQLDLQQGDKVSIRYVDGYWRASDSYQDVGADGYGNINDANGMVYGALLAKIGDGSPFEIGVSYSFTANESGYLFFQINDNVLTNNSGSINIEISLEN